MFKRNKLAGAMMMLILAPLMLGALCNKDQKLIIRNRYDGKPLQVTRQDRSYYVGRSDWACVPADLKSIAIFFRSWELAGMSQLQIIQRHDLDGSGYMSHYEAARACIAHGMNVEQIYSAYTPDEALTELYKRVDLRHPTLVGFGYGDNGPVGHMVVCVGYLAKSNGGQIRGFYFMDPDPLFFGYRYEENFIVKALLASPEAGFYALTAVTGDSYGAYKPIAENGPGGTVDALKVSDEAPANVEGNGSGGMMFFRPAPDQKYDGGGSTYPPYPDDPIEKMAADATLQAGADGVVGPGGDFGYLYDQYYSTVRFADAGEVVMKGASPEIPCNYTAHWSLPVVDASGAFRGMVAMQQVYICKQPPGPVEMSEYIIRFPDQVVAEKVAAGGAAPVEPLLTYKVKDENPGYVVKSVWGPNKIDYPTPLFPFVEITDPTTGEARTFGPRGEEITWNDEEYVLVQGAESYRPMKPIATTQKLTATVAPNPFNPTATIRFSLPEASTVTLEVFNILGQKVTTLIDGTVYQPGNHAVTFDGRDNTGTPLGSGAYFYRFTAGEFRRTGKMMLLK